ncbi:MAG: hypothetical protein Q6373_004165 [Candidatus Sigynarchaeota archaeon]
MLVKDTIVLEAADHAELGKLLFQKIRKEGISIRDAAIFPVSTDSVFVLASLLMSDEAGEIHGAIWMPGENKPPISPETKTILLVDAIVQKSSTRARQAKRVLDFLLKRLKLEKKLKGIKFYAPCWLSDAETRDRGDGIHLIPAAFAPDIEKIVPFSADAKTIEGARKLAFKDAIQELKWEIDHVYMEKHEIVLQKLKTELWE